MTNADCLRNAYNQYRVLFAAADTTIHDVPGTLVVFCMAHISKDEGHFV